MPAHDNRPMLLPASGDDDADADDESIVVAVPASSETGPPRMRATGMGGGATGSGTILGRVRGFQLSRVAFFRPQAGKMA